VGPGAVASDATLNGPHERVITPAKTVTFL
jgi:hypothetical protein